MLVVGDRDQPRADEAFLGHQLQFAGMAEQLRSYEDGDVLDVFTAIAGCLLALEMGVDRHLRDAASTDGVDEVDGCGATFRSNGVQR